jgi:hypothetical protein
MRMLGKVGGARLQRFAVFICDPCGHAPIAARHFARALLDRLSIRIVAGLVSLERQHPGSNTRGGAQAFDWVPIGRAAINLLSQSRDDLAQEESFIPCRCIRIARHFVGQLPLPAKKGLSPKRLRRLCDHIDVIRCRLEPIPPRNRSDTRPISRRAGRREPPQNSDIKTAIGSNHGVSVKVIKLLAML